MAKKVVASTQQKGAKNFTRCIKMVKSPKTGAYTFKEEMVANTEIDAYLKK
ncbi:MAG TPA: DUF4295 domain-containing protein [Tenuifilaceae bacterium]|nr:DUF4295 domain-containing protein [Tenuifilaceae bacterium]HPM89176.1 DUF4295 domain-containing protein [Tenuifilaceae bacterium]HPW25711.1 DUF4295 domain-containing protein [Tenuifilaceae bacterium]